MSDFFHEDADEWRDEAWDIIRKTPQHTYQILTKRPERILDALPADWSLEEDGYDNVWLGTSVESQLYLDNRAYELLDIPARVHFLSCEPLLGPLNFPNYHWWRWIDWVITGGESDLYDPRLSDPDWFRDVREQCKEVGVAYFHKQNGGSTKCKCHGAWGCRLLDGRTYDEMPQILLEAL